MLMLAPRPPYRLLALIFGILHTIFIVQFSHAFHSQPVFSRATKLCSTSSETSTSSTNNKDVENTTILYFDIGIPTSPTETIPLGRLTFHLTPQTHPHHLPLPISNLISLASSQRKSIDPKATYEGCAFQYSPSTIDDGSFRYRWGHVCDGYGRNGIQTTLASGVKTSWDEPFSDPLRSKECAHNCFGGVYYGQKYEDILDIVTTNNNDGRQDDDTVILLTVPISGPGAGTSKFSIVRVSESPREWGERLLLNSAVVGYLDCGADGSFGFGEAEDEESGGPTCLEVLRFMARQRMGPPTIINCGVTPS